MKKQEAFITQLLRTRLNRFGIKPTDDEFNELFRDFVGYWQEAETEAYSPKHSKQWVLDKLDLYLLYESAQDTCQ